MADMDDNKPKHLKPFIDWSPEGFTAEEGGAHSLVLLRMYEEGGRRYVSALQYQGVSEAEGKIAGLKPADLYYLWLCMTGLVSRSLPPSPEQDYLTSVLAVLGMNPNLTPITSVEPTRPEASNPAELSTTPDEVVSSKD